MTIELILKFLSECSPNRFAPLTNVLNKDFSLKDKGVSNALSISELPRHRWYFIKEGFDPRLVQQAMATENVVKGDVLLDPFSGSGTVALTGASAGLNATSFEINPFLRFLSATKLRHASAKAFTKSKGHMLAALNRRVDSPLEGYSTFSSPNRWNRWLFNRNVLRSFESGKRATEHIPQDLRDLTKLALLGAALDCCNAQRDGKCLRYRKEWRDNPFSTADLINAFEKRHDQIAEDLETLPLTQVAGNVIEGDARDLVVSAPTPAKFRLCVTSPPYLNSFDYSDVYRPELFLGDFVKTNDDLMAVRLKTVRSHVQASWDAPVRKEFGTLYADCMKSVKEIEAELWDHRIPAMIQAYFEDMEKILSGLRIRAMDNASAWFVVSTSAYGGVEIPVDLILAEIGQRNGWFLREVGVLRYLRSSGQHMKSVGPCEGKSVLLRESVVIFDATRPRKK